MEIQTNRRGFQFAIFSDTKGMQCSIQKSSSVGDAIWLGIDKTNLTVFENEQRGNYVITEMPANFSVNTRMHLSIEQVEELLPILQNFVKNGELLSNSEPIEPTTIVDSIEKVSLVEAIYGGQGHWYLVPTDVLECFIEDDRFCAIDFRDKFKEKWDKYFIGGGRSSVNFNWIQLYVKLNI